MEINLPNEGMPKIPPMKSTPLIFLFVILFVIFSGAGSLFYQVSADEVGVVQRFGKYARTANPGLQMKLPFGIETVRLIKVTHVFKEEFGFRTVQSGPRSVYAGREIDQNRSQNFRLNNRNFANGGDPFLEESMMLTGDLNVAVVEWIIQYTIKDPVQYAFRIRNPRETIRNMSEAIMRLVVGDKTIKEVLTQEREEIGYEVQRKLQEVLDSYGLGVAIQNVILQEVTPPDEVKPSFNEVNEARQEKEKVVNQAWEEYNRVIPKAKGEAEQLIRSAEGYALERINKALGDAERFNLSLAAYQAAPVVTKKRLYLEMLDQVMPELREKMFMDDAQKGLLPLLNLNQEHQGVEK